MKISSRPTATPMGSGAYTVNMSFEQLQLIATFVSMTRLGQGSPYKTAAFDFLRMFEQEFGDDFTDTANTDINMTVSVVDEDCDPIVEYPYTDICFEV